LKVREEKGKESASKEVGDVVSLVEVVPESRDWCLFLWSSGLHMFLPRHVGLHAEGSLGAKPYVVSLARLRSDLVDFVES
jgi:hypothetical protein